MITPARLLVATLLAFGLVGCVFFGAMLGYGQSRKGEQACERGLGVSLALIAAGWALAAWLGV